VTDAVLSHPVSTRGPVTARDGLAAGIVALAEIAPPGLVIEATAPQDLGATRSAARAAGRPVIAVVGAPFVVGADPLAPLDAPTPAAADLAGTGLLSTISACSDLGARRLVVPTADAACAGDVEQALDQLCRRLHRLAAAESGLLCLLLPSARPEALLNPERCEWVLDDVPARNVGLALDLGVLGLRHARGGEAPGAWCERLGGRVGLVLVADTDGTRADLPAGMGSVDYGALAPALGRGVPRALRGPCDLPSEVVFDHADRVARELLGNPPDLLHLI